MRNELVQQICTTGPIGRNKHDTSEASFAAAQQQEQSDFDDMIVDMAMSRETRSQSVTGNGPKMDMRAASTPGKHH